MLEPEQEAAQMVLIAFIVWAQAAQPTPIKVSNPQDVIEVRTLNGFVTAGRAVNIFAADSFLFFVSFGHGFSR